MVTEATGNRAHRIFARTQNIGFDDEEREIEVKAADMNEVIQSIMSQARRNGRHVRIEPVSKNQVKLVVFVKGATTNRDEQIIQLKDWSL